MSSVPHTFRLAVWRTVLSLIIILCMSMPAFAKTVTVESSTVNIRKGPGNYFEVIYTATEGARLTVVEELDNWYKVALPDNKAGYVSIKSLSKRMGRDLGRQKAWLRDKGVGQVASSEIMAATKGIVDMGEFAQAYASKHSIDPSVLEQFDEMPFTPEEYERFKESLRHRRNVRIGEFSDEGIGEYDREVGTAIALRLAAMGVHNDAELRKYISLVGTAAVESTPLYDETFVFIVLDDSQVRSFATPGGFVFITTGALELMKDEAELAGVLGHEVVHVVQRHGISELEKQRTRIQSEKLIGDLDRELEALEMDRGDRAVMEDLESLADQMFERLISGRLKEAEEESDRLGTMVIYNTGYTADGLMRFILSTGRLEAKKKDPSFSHQTADERADMLKNVIKKKRLQRRDREKHQERFQEHVK